jgi:hypothetical protein
MTIEVRGIGQTPEKIFPVKADYAKSESYTWQSHYFHKRLVRLTIRNQDSFIVVVQHGH